MPIVFLRLMGFRSSGLDGQMVRTRFDGLLALRFPEVSFASFDDCLASQVLWGSATLNDSDPMLVTDSAVVLRG
jgi:hypothetical protein